MREPFYIELDGTYRPVRNDPDWIKIAAWVVILAFVSGFWYAISVLV